MSFSINFCGGALLIMMGQNTRSESLFSYFRLEDHIPQDHLLRLVDRHIDFTFVRETLPQRTLKINCYEDVREHVRKLGETSEFAAARRARNEIEALFSELRNQIRLRKLRLRGLPRAGEQFILAATVQNIKRLIRFLNQSKEPEYGMA